MHETQVSVTGGRGQRCPRGLPAGASRGSPQGILNPFREPPERGRLASVRRGHTPPARPLAPQGEKPRKRKEKA